MAAGQRGPARRTLGSANVDAFRSTLGGSRMLRRADLALNELGLTAAVGGGENLPIGELLRQRGKGGIEALRNRIMPGAQALREKAIEGIRAAPGYKGGPISDEQIYAADKSGQLRRMEGVLKVLTNVLIRLESGKGINVTAISKTNDPGDRANNRIEGAAAIGAGMVAALNAAGLITGQ